MTTLQRVRVWGRGGERGGFTLIELIGALAVLSVAITILIKLFSSSLDLETIARNRTIAGQLAEGQLTAILKHPERFRWDLTEENADAPFAIKQAADDPSIGVPFAAPSVMPADVRAHELELKAYEKFSWRAFGRFSDADALAEVTVVVCWRDAKNGIAVRPTFTLTTAAPVRRTDAQAWVGTQPSEGGEQ
jgi:prepilin-type N-terminal cleavage/methylation domain-containing protein